LLAAILTLEHGATADFADAFTGAFWTNDPTVGPLHFAHVIVADFQVREVADGSNQAFGFGVHATILVAIFNAALRPEYHPVLTPRMTRQNPPPDARSMVIPAARILRSMADPKGAAPSTGDGAAKKSFNIFVNHALDIFWGSAAIEPAHIRAIVLIVLIVLIVAVNALPAEPRRVSLIHLRAKCQPVGFVEIIPECGINDIAPAAWAWLHNRSACAFLFGSPFDDSDAFDLFGFDGHCISFRVSPVLQPAIRLADG
jgi:hypothetical protein